ncbi:NADP-dependent oxidoreductase domain-containing protein [Suillus ampliporus]|nr:NADP-dependent oxidoreductase domain-containing protein [Suillus ampliporus]
MEPFPKPSYRLARYRVLAPTAGVHVSPLQLGGTSIGDKWEAFGLNDKTSSFKLLDVFYEAGGNFIDNAKWAERRDIRDQLMIATKYTANYKRGNDGIRQKVQYTGNNKLRASYIDILYVHWWDWDTSAEDVMNGNVLYLGISDAPAWVVSKANQYACDHEKSPFWDFERDIIPMARSEGLALAHWNVLAGGRLRSNKEEERRRQTGGKDRMFANNNWERNETERAMSAALENVAKEVGAKHSTTVAIAYLIRKTPYVFPIIGGRKSLAVVLTPEQVKYLESIVPFEPGFPNTTIGDGTPYCCLLLHVAYLEKQPQMQPIIPNAD